MPMRVETKARGSEVDEVKLGLESHARINGRVKLGPVRVVYRLTNWNLTHVYEEPNTCVMMAWTNSDAWKIHGSKSMVVRQW